MDKRPIKKRIIWRNFAKLMAVAFVLVSLSALYIYQSSMSVAKEQFLRLNEQKTEILNSGLRSAIEQAERIASALCVDSDSFLLFEGDRPEDSDAGLWKRMSAKLKTYSFGVEYVDSIILYSPSHKRMIGETDAEAIPIATAGLRADYDTGWLQYIPELGVNETMLKARSIRNSYPYALSLIKHYQRVNCEGIVIINLDLKHLYAEIWSEQADTQAYVLDHEGRVLISKNKSALLENRADYADLVDFTLTENSKSVLLSDAAIPYTYAQAYDADLGLFAVTRTNLVDYRQQVAQKEAQIFAVYIICVACVALMMMLYCTVSFRPFNRIMELLDNPNSWKQKEGESSQIPEIVEKIVYHLQVNEELKTALDERLDLLKATQIQALQSQLNPHFIYNSLDAIGAMVEELEGEDGKVSKMVDNLVDVSRYAISGQELVPVETELEYLRKFTYILECRYANSFAVDFDFDESLANARIPRLILQPLIENAVFHGLMARSEETGGRLTVKGRAVQYRFEESADEEAAIRVDVADNGYGMTPEKLEELRAAMSDLKRVESQHIGVQNTVKRLYLLFPNRMHINIQSERDEGTTITLIFPREQ